MAVALALVLAMQAAAPNSWEMGGGQSWNSQPGGAYCQLYKRSCIDPTIRETRRFSRMSRRELEGLEAKARGGDVLAMRKVGLAKMHRKDERAGLGWIYEAAIRGDPVSMYVLGRAFEDGLGVEPDPKLASFWLSRAAAHGVTVGKRQ